ncbi:MAG TPA: lytic murein transglycosylase, partial [Rhodocyclaceae bacterium]|nr:lytic murein transglycosylase [Rhodocyclaceae bacterium]
MTLRSTLAAGLAALVLGVPVARAADVAQFAPCVAGLKAGAVARGVSPAGYERLTAGLEPDLKVLDFLDYQPEFRT